MYLYLFGFSKLLDTPCIAIEEPEDLLAFWIMRFLVVSNKLIYRGISNLVIKDSTQRYFKIVGQMFFDTRYCLIKKNSVTKKLLMFYKHLLFC